MRINVYTEELLRYVDNDKPVACEIVTADYVSSRTGQPMKNWGLRIYLASAPELHYVPPRDDDRSAVTFWCGDKEKNVIEFLDLLRGLAYQCTLKTWHDKTEAQVSEAVAAETGRREMPVHPGCVKRHPDLPKSVPMALFLPHEKQAQTNHGQSLERLAERGGLDWIEMDWILRGIRWGTEDQHTLAHEQKCADRVLAELAKLQRAP